MAVFFTIAFNHKNLYLLRTIDLVGLGNGDPDTVALYRKMLPFLLLRTIGQFQRTPCSKEHSAEVIKRAFWTPLSITD
jgi:hypothetical protein